MESPYTEEYREVGYRKVLRIGLGQIPLDGLKRLRDWIKEGKPILLDGAIMSLDGTVCCPMATALPEEDRKAFFDSGNHQLNNQTILRTAWQNITGKWFDINPSFETIFSFGGALIRSSEGMILEVVEELIEEEQNE